MSCRVRGASPCSQRLRSLVGMGRIACHNLTLATGAINTHGMQYAAILAAVGHGLARLKPRVRNCSRDFEASCLQHPGRHLDAHVREERQRGGDTSE